MSVDDDVTLAQTSTLGNDIFTIVVLAQLLVVAPKIQHTKHLFPVLPDAGEGLACKGRVWLMTIKFCREVVYHVTVLKLYLTIRVREDASAVEDTCQICLSTKKKMNMINDDWLMMISHRLTAAQHIGRHW